MRPRSGLPSLMKSRSGARLLAVFALTVLAPGVLLVALAARALTQETQRADDEITARLDRAAERAAQVLADALEAWRNAAIELTTNAPRDVSDLPPALQSAAAASEGLATVSVDANGVRMWPANALAYIVDGQPSPPEAVPPASLDFARAEQLERRGSTTEAAQTYRRLLVDAGDRDRPVLLQRLARIARAEKRPADARLHLRELGRHTGPAAGPLPADLVAAFELCDIAAEEGDLPALASCAREFNQALATGRWSLSRYLYLFYADTSRAWLAKAGATPEDVARVAARDATRLALTEAVEAALTTTGATGSSQRMAQLIRLPHHVAIVWPAEGDIRERLALVVPAPWFDDRLTSMLDSQVDEVVHVAVSAADGSPLLQTGVMPERVRPSAREASVTDDEGRLLRLSVWPRDPEALAAEAERRRSFYLMLLGLIALVMTSGTYLTVRAVRQELAVAQLKADFVAAVSHEFRSPLTGIRQLGELLMRGRVATDDRRQEYYARITQESDRLSRMVEHLLDFARMESGRREYTREPLAPGPWMRDLVAAFARQHADEADVSVEVASDLPMIEADHEALACAVQNLLDNAVKYSPGRAVVDVSVARSDEGLAIRVRDEGEGMSADERARVFDTFYRAKRQARRHVPGAGIGLSLVQHIVSAHGGRVTCDSEPGRGTTFTIHLPAPAGEAEPSSKWSARASAPAKN